MPAASKAQNSRASYCRGGAWTLVRRDGVLDTEVRLILETNDRHQIYMHWKGLRRVPKDVIDRLHRNETVDPRTYYFRATPYFETGSEKYGWMNCICAVATGSVATNARTLDVFFRCCSRYMEIADVRLWPLADTPRGYCRGSFRGKADQATVQEPPTANRAVNVSRRYDRPGRLRRFRRPPGAPNLLRMCVSDPENRGPANQSPLGDGAALRHH
jgi:Protein of unknown function (DUF3237)